MIISNFKKIFPHLMKAGISPMLWSKPGQGKTEIQAQIAEELGYNFIYLTLAACEDNSDLIGLLSPIKDEAGNDVAVRHLKPDWFPQKSKNIIFLDETNRVPKQIIQTLLTFINDKKLHTHLLPPDTHFVLAANPPDEKHIVGDISDMAFISRLCHISLEPSVEEFLDYAASKRASDDIISFIQENPEMLDVVGPTYLPEIDFNRRTWLKFISPFLLSNPPKDLIFEVVRGLVGTVAAVKFQNHIKNNQFKIKGREILNDYGTVLSNRVKSHQNDLDVLNIAGEELVREIKVNKGVTEKQGLNVVAFLSDTPIEYCYNLSRQIMGLGIESLNKNIGENTELIERMRNKLDGMSK